jgi:hypothetical protein
MVHKIPANDFYEKYSRLCGWSGVLAAGNPCERLSPVFHSVRREAGGLCGPASLDLERV